MRPGKPAQRRSSFASGRAETTPQWNQLSMTLCLRSNGHSYLPGQSAVGIPLEIHLMATQSNGMGGFSPVLFHVSRRHTSNRPDRRCVLFVPTGTRILGGYVGCDDREVATLWWIPQRLVPFLEALTEFGAIQRNRTSFSQCRRRESNDNVPAPPDPRRWNGDLCDGGRSHGSLLRILDFPEPGSRSASSARRV